jgi:thioredoxin 1
MGVTDITKDTFQTEVIDAKGIVFVDFFATWCGPCKMTAPIIDQLANEYKDIKFVKVDVDQNGELASEYSIFSIPTFVVFKDGKMVSQFSGGRGKEGFVEELQKIK